MDNNNLEIYKILAGLLGGGAVGAIITNVITHYKNRIQTVQKSIKIIPFFSSEKLSNIDLSLSIKGDLEVFEYKNITIVDIDLKNAGNKDYQDFNFGITIPDNFKIINFVGKNPDRHHKIEQQTQVNLRNTQSYIDLVFQPFNRKDNYNFLLLITRIQGNDDIIEDDITFSTSSPVKFIKNELTLSFFELIFTSFTSTIAGNIVYSKSGKFN